MTANQPGNPTDAEVDLTNEPVFSTEPIPAPEERPFDPTRAREVMRGAIALALLSTLFLLLVAAHYTYWKSSEVKYDDYMKLLNLVFTPVVALVSTAIGFYFGERAASTGRGRGRR